jgi:hypothetical protein
MLPLREQNGTGTGASARSRLDSTLGDLGGEELRGRADPDHMDVEAPSGRPHGPHHSGLAAGHRAVPRCRSHDQRMVTRRGHRHRGADHGVLHLEVEPGRPQSRCRYADARRGPACYRSQFPNTTLPSGVLGDVHRAVRPGRDVGDENRALRAVAWATLHRPGRPDRAGNNRAARSAVAGALVHAGRSIAVVAGGWASSSCVGRCPMAGRPDRGGSCA